MLPTGKLSKPLQTDKILLTLSQCHNQELGMFMSTGEITNCQTHLQDLNSQPQLPDIPRQ